MTLFDLLNDYSVVSIELKHKALDKIVEVAKKRPDDELLWSLISTAVYAEDDDYFGTEGLEI